MVIDKSFLEENERSSNIQELKAMALLLSKYFHKKVEVVLLKGRYFFTVREGIFKLRTAVGHVEAGDIMESDDGVLTIFCYDLWVAEILDKDFGERGHTFSICDKVHYYEETIL